MQNSIDIFLGYAAEDKELCLEVKKRLKWLEKAKLIRMWHEYTISPGVERERELLRYLEMAHIILLFVSADFINSDFCYGLELEQAMRRHNQGEARVIPIILRSVYWQETPIGKLQVLPRGDRPVKNWSNQDDVLAAIEEDLRIIIKELVAAKWLQEARDSFKQQQYKKTVDACNQTLRLVSSSTDAYRLQGIALLILKRYDLAIEVYDKLIELGSTDASIYKER